jgi:hypothetical protein
VIKNEDKNHENEKATPQKAHIESIEDLAPTFSTASTPSGHRNWHEPLGLAALAVDLDQSSAPRPIESD